MMGEIKSYLNQSATHIDDFPLKPVRIAELIALIDSDKISNSAAAQQLFPLMLKSPERTPESIAESENLLQKNDDAWLESIAHEALSKFPDKVAAYKAGNKGLLGLFMGEVMKLSDRKANPKMASEIIKKILD
jgi:aspartyl-tRNA(Asn)/glutamyl-tRNA(Gln) amidotransferase subunit B